MTPGPHTADTTAHGRLRDLFDAVLERPTDQRHDWIAAHVADPGERSALHRLISAEATTARSLLDTPAAERAARIGEHAEPRACDLIGQRIGAFRLLRLLGQGGMATVFLAERESADFAQQVAIKLLRRGLYSELEQRLFRRERQALAMLSHPNIARLIDGGVTETGIPYLVMDYIDGVPITQYAVETQLDPGSSPAQVLRARLRLFLVVCRAVDAAHRQLIVHRDLKPSNILVSDDGTVTLLDFGIAKLLDEDDSATRTGLAALTPGYAAPEQYSGAQISTATDVYALGVLLHELLLGTRPESAEAQRSSTFNASTPPKSALQAALRGDLHNIVQKALANEPHLRYASAGAFAEDIERHLDGRPVAAHPPSQWYRIRRFVRRHRGSVALTTLFALGLIVSLGIALWQAGVARREALRANQQTQVARLEAERATAVRDLMVQLFENELPGQARGELPDTATLLGRGAQLARQRHVSPEVQIDMLVTIGRVYDQVSRHAQARPLLEQAVVLARAQPDSHRARLGEALSQLGQLELSQKRYPAALAHFEEALKLQQLADAQGLATAMTLHRRALVYSETDRHDRAIADYRAALAIRERALPATDPLRVNSYGALGTAYERARRSTESEPWQRRALTLARRIHGDVHEQTARRASNLALTLTSLGQNAEAASLFAEAVAIDRRVFAAPNSSAAVRLHNLASMQIALGRVAVAHRNLRESMRIDENVGNIRTPGYGHELIQLAHVHRILGDAEQAAALARLGTEILRSALGSGHFSTLRGELRSAHFDFENGQPAALVRTRVEAAQRELHRIPDPHIQAYARYLRGLTLIPTNPSEGARDIERALAAVRKGKQLRFDPVEWYEPLAASQASRGDPAVAMQTLREGLAFADQLALPRTHYLRARLLLDLAELEWRSGQTLAARNDAQAAIAAMQTELPATHPWQRRANDLLARS